MSDHRIHPAPDGDQRRPPEGFQHQIAGGPSRARRDGKPHSGSRPATPKQLRFLRKLGATKKETADLSRLEASDMITLLLNRQMRGGPTGPSRVRRFG